MRAVGEGRLANDSATFERHIDRCLGCRACEQVCPAGVEYGQLLEAARGELFVSGPRRGLAYGLLRLVLKFVWLQPRRVRFAFTMARLVRDSGLARGLRKSGVARLISQRFEFGLALLESSEPKLTTAQVNPMDRRRVAVTLPPNPPANPPVDITMLFTGCVGAGLFSRVNKATTRVLEANGFLVQIPAEQVCCGALHAHAGDLEGARTLARRNIIAFAVGQAFLPVRSAPGPQETPIVTNAGGCGAMLASYPHLLADDESFAERARRFSGRVRDISQQLETVKMKTGAGGREQLVTYDASCHLLYGQQAGTAPLKVMSAVPGLTLAPLASSERCCGGAGIYNLLEADLSARVLEEKLADIQATGAPTLATGNPGCQMQIGAGAILSGMHIATCHPVELLDEAYARAGIYQNMAES